MFARERMRTSRGWMGMRHGAGGGEHANTSSRSTMSWRNRDRPPDAVAAYGDGCMARERAERESRDD